MPEKMREVLDKILAWWKKFTSKQKMLMVSLTAVVLIALIILAVVMSRPETTTLITCADTAQASEVQSLLTGENISSTVSRDGLTFTINVKDEARAKMLLGANSIPALEPSIDDVVSGGMGTTEADKEKKYKQYKEERYAYYLETLDNVEEASVSLDVPANDGTIISQEKDTYVAVKLNLSGTMTEEQAAGIAQYLATSVGNDDTSSIHIIDTKGNVLFSGVNSSTEAGLTSTQLAYQTKLESKVKSEVKDVLMGSGVYNSVEVGLNLKVDFDQVNEVDHNYYIPEGREEGYITSESTFESTSQGGVSGEPGTGSNDDTPTYVMPDGTITSQEVTDQSINRALSEKVTEKKGGIGGMIPEESSITVVATNYVTYSEDALRANGTLDDMTFEEFRAQNDQWVKTTADQELYDMVANATGISADNISIVTYDVPDFIPTAESGRSWTDYMQIALAVLIFALLGYVVLRSTRKETEPELEPELSVEALLETTKEAEQNELEDIGYNEKSETRLLIEKFVDENPEAVALLLRNWLNEEWN